MSEYDSLPLEPSSDVSPYDALFTFAEAQESQAVTEPAPASPYDALFTFAKAQEGQAASPSPYDALFAMVAKPMTREEFAAKRKDEHAKPMLDKFYDLTAGIGDGIGGIVNTVADAAGEIYDTPGSLKRLPATAVEGLARGTYDMANLGRKIGNNGHVQIAEAIQNPALILDPHFRAGLGAALSPDAESSISHDYQKYLDDFAFEQQRAEGMDGTGNLAPKLIGEPLPKTAEAASLVLDPSLVIPGVGEASKMAGLTSRLAGRAAAPVAHVVEAGGRVVGEGMSNAARATVGAIERAGINPTALKTGASAIGVASLGTGVGQAVATTAAGTAATAGVAKVAETTGKMASAFIDESLKPASQLSITERIARDPSKPAWLRRAAATANAVPEPLARAPGAVARGALHGAVTGGALAAASDEDAAGIGRGIGGGIALGSAGALVGDNLPEARKRRAVEAEDADIGWALKRQEELGGAVGRLILAPREQQLQIATLQRVFDDKTDIVLLRGSEFADRSPQEHAAGVYMEQTPEGRSRIAVNLDAGIPPGRLLMHEVAHSLIKSPAVGDKDAVRLAVSRIYGDAGLESRGREYARRTLEAERRNLPPAMPVKEIDPGLLAETGRSQPPPPLDPRRITPAEIDTRFKQLTQQAIDGGDIDGRDWLRDEVFAEHFASEMDGKGLTLDNLRRGTPPGGDRSAMREAMLNARGKVLAAFGVPFDETGRISTPTSRLFIENPLIRDAGIQRLIGRMNRERTQWIEGLHSKDEPRDTPKGTPLAEPGKFKPLANSPAVEWRKLPDGTAETDFAVRTTEGQVFLKDEREIKQLEADRATQARSLAGSETLPAGSSDFGKKRIDGREVIGGSKLPARFDALNKFSSETKAVARAMENSHATGETFSLWYHGIGSGADGSWATAVRKKLGNVSATQRELSHIGWSLTKAGNIVGQLLDVGAARARAFDLQSQGKLTLWNGSVDSFQKDFMAYLKNHSDGLPGETGLGVAKRDFINGVLGATTAVNRAANPLYSGQLGRTLIKSFRLDRMNNVKPTSRTGWAVDYARVKNNLHPDVGGEVSMSKSATKEPRPNPGFAISDQQRHAEKMVQGWANPPEVRVLTDVSQIPEPRVRSMALQAQAAGGGVEAFHQWVKDGKGGFKSRVTIIGSMVDSPARLQALILHESIGHSGLQTLFRGKLADRFQEITAGVWDKLSKSRFDDKWNEKHGYRTLPELAERYGFDTTTADGRGRLVEEHLARIAESGQRPAWFASVIAQIRDLIRRAAPQFVHWTDNDILALLEGARKAVQGDFLQGINEE